MKVTIDGSKGEIKEVLQAISGSSKHMESVQHFSKVVPKPIIERRKFAKESEKDQDLKEN
ncbi:hypothetical protein G8J22_02417 [Lentilactobacillus hilgardii]|uniref:hypothetical protein n=1 Tax=Lentilactobacillus hilgardii TaxID=1588 RepID=UPI00030BDBDE|nr:hypothetical protein [Lentilactobacillus hilgardii]QIR10409.1 hypothetical protein G8J22_02417 [Lentilactobacillus hilgardii]